MQLPCLSDTELQTARENNLLRPNLVRSEVIGFKRQLRSTLDNEQERCYRRLVAERERLLARLQEIEKELATVTKVNQRRRHLLERCHARRSLVKGRGRICRWVEASAPPDQAAAAV
jgi:hypothetical protein